MSADKEGERCPWSVPAKGEGGKKLWPHRRLNGQRSCFAGVRAASLVVPFECGGQKPINRRITTEEDPHARWVLFILLLTPAANRLFNHLYNNVASWGGGGGLSFCFFSPSPESESRLEIPEV